MQDHQDGPCPRISSASKPESVGRNLAASFVSGLHAENMHVGIIIYDQQTSSQDLVSGNTELRPKPGALRPPEPAVPPRATPSSPAAKAGAVAEPPPATAAPSTVALPSGVNVESDMVTYLLRCLEAGANMVPLPPRGSLAALVYVHVPCLHINFFRFFA